MGRFTKIVLSRKGYDSSAGGSFSPYDPDSLNYIVLPIPQKEGEAKIGNPLKFEDVKIRSDYLPYNASNLKGVIEATGRKQTLRENSKWIYCEHTHFDPWLGPCPWLSGDSDHHIGAFGQVGIPQKHLCKNGVGEGSLFLFFSRFVPIRGRKNNLGIQIREEKGAYFLYGWLRVGKVVKRFMDIPNEEIKSRHPHATEAYFNNKENNAIYIADQLLFADDTVPGCGYFSKLNNRLLLSSKKHLDAPLIWELPGFFYETRPTVLKKRKWCRNEDGSCLVEIPRRWQEAVFDDSEDFCIWFKDLIKREGQKSSSL